MSDNLVTIFSYINPMLAHIHKSKLESKGVYSFIANDALIPHIQALSGGVQLKVRISDIKKAQKILKIKNENVKQY